MKLRNSRPWRWALVPIAVGALLALGVARADATTIASIPMPGCCPNDTISAGNSVFALSARFGGTEHSILVKINPNTNMVSGRLALDPGVPAGNGLNVNDMVYAAGSIWVVQALQNEVLRIDPARMRILTRVPTGRTPSSVATDGTSVWIALQHDSAIARIDPATNTVTASVPVGARNGADGPWQLSYDGTQLLASLPTSGRVARLDPRTLRVRYDQVGTAAAQCAHILPAPGGYWLDDTECSYDYFRWDAATRTITADVTPLRTNDFGAVVVGSALYTAEFDCTDVSCGNGHLIKRDVYTGAVLADVSTGNDASAPHFADGSLWVGNWADVTLERVALF